MEKLEKSLIIALILLMLIVFTFITTTIFIVKDVVNEYQEIKAENRDLKIELYKCYQPKFNCSNPIYNDTYYYCEVEP